MASPAIRLSSDGVTYGSPGVKMGFTEGTTVHAKLDSIAGVSVCEWKILFADGVNSAPADYTIVADTGAVVGDKVKFDLPAAKEGVSVILQSTINNGVGPNGNVDYTVTQARIKAYVLASNGLEVPAVGEEFEGDPVYGTAPQVTAAILNAGVAGGGVTTSRQINTTAPLTGGGDLTANRTLGISPATDAAAGSMSAADKALIDAATANATPDTLALRGGSAEAFFGFVGPSGAVAGTGFVRMPSATTALAFRNAGNAADVAAIAIDGSDAIQIGDGTNGTGYVTVNVHGSGLLVKDNGTEVFAADSGTSQIRVAVPSVLWGSGVSAPTLTQTTLAGTGAAQGQAMTIQAQAGQNQSGANNNNAGGSLTLSGGSAGTGGAGSAGTQGSVSLKGGGNTVSLTAGSLTVDAPAITFAGNDASPFIEQAQAAGTGAAAGQSLTVQAQPGQAQTGTAANNNGGTLALNGGAAGTGGSGAAGTQGSVTLQGGGLTATLSGSGLALPMAANFQPIAAPSAPASGWKVYADSGDSNRLKAIDSAGRIGYVVPTLRVSNSKTMSANATTAKVNLFQVTGVVRVVKLYGVVTTTIGANHTASQFFLTDGSTNAAISAAAAVALSAAAAGSFLAVNGMPATQTAVGTSDIPRVGDSAANLEFFQDMTCIARYTANTYIMYQYTTTDAPTSGVIQFFVEYEPLSADGLLTAV